MERAQMNKYIKPYSKPSIGKSSLQIINTVVPYLLLVVGMYFLIRYNIPYIITLVIALAASLLYTQLIFKFKKSYEYMGTCLWNSNFYIFL